MKFKPAGIKTIREAIERLMNGEVFYSPDGYEIIYDDVNIVCDATNDVNPFKAVRGAAMTEPINFLWKKVSDWKVECKWEDNIGDGVLCWVSDYNRIPDKHDCVRFITAYHKDRVYPYRSGDVGYKFAIPVTLKEVEKYIKG